MPLSAFDEIRSDEYSEAVEARELGTRLIKSNERHAHLRDATVGYLFRDDEVRDHESKVVAGSAHLVSQLIAGAGAKYFGRFAKWALQKELGYLPDFLILIDSNLWSGYSDREKHHLINHELTHCIQKTDDEGEPRFNRTTGEPVWGIRPHDLEEFCDVVAEGGLVTEDHRQMARVMVDAAIREERA